MSEQYTHDVFISYSSSDKEVVRPLAERLRHDGLRVWFDEWEIKPGDSIPSRIEQGLEESRVLILCMSQNAFGSDWAQLEAGTFRFRDPLNKDRRFVPLRFDDVPIKGSLAQFLSIDWYRENRAQEYEKLLDVCRIPSHRLEPTETEERLPVATLSLGHTSYVTSMAVSADGKYVLTGSRDETVRLWELSTGRCVRIMEGHTDTVTSVAASADGKYALSGSDDTTIRQWELSTGRCVRVMDGHTDYVTCVAVSADSKHALSGSGDKSVRQWELSTGRCFRVMEGHAGSVLSVAVSVDGKYALSGSHDSTVRQWELSTGRCLRVMKGHTDSVTGVAVSADGKHALSGSHDSTVRQWKLPTGRCLRVMTGHTGSVNSVAVSADGKYMLSGSHDQTVRQWELSTGCCLRVMEGHTSFVTSVAVTAVGTIALSGSGDSSVRQWELSTGRCLRVLKGHVGFVNSVAVSAFGKYVVSGSGDNTVRQWELSTGCCLRAMEGHTSSVLSVAVSADGKCALSGSFDNTVRQWELSTGRCIRVMEGHVGFVNSVAVSVDGKYALSCSGDETVRQWELSTGRCVRVMEGHTISVTSVVASADGQYALSGSADKTVRQWELSTGRCLRVMKGHTGPVYSVALSADGQYALSGSGDNTIRQWELSTGRCLRVMEGHARFVYSVAVSADGKYALSGSADKTVRQWETSTGRCLGVIGEHSEVVVGAGFVPNSGRMFSAAINGVMRIWDTEDAPVVPPADFNQEEQAPYANAKVLLVGDSGVGKTGLSNYLARGIKMEEDKPLLSTDGAWATHWPLAYDEKKAGIQREIWLWDFAGQVDYRLVHQLYMNDAAVVMLVFNPQDVKLFEGLGRWDRDVQRAIGRSTAKLIVAGRVDRGGLTVSADSMSKFMDERNFCHPLHQTSAVTGEGCDQLREAIVQTIDWENIPETTSPILYHRLKRHILSLRDKGLVLVRLAELKQRVELTLRDVVFKPEELDTVVDLLAGPGMIQRLDFGGFILLRPEVLSRYAAAAVRRVRKHPQELGCIREDELLAGNLDYQDFERIPPEDEVVVLRALLETFVSRAWCLRQPCDGSPILTFPSYFRRERKEQPGHPSVLVTYRFDGPADEIYATLVVRLHHTIAFQSSELWRSAADFKTQTGEKLGFTLLRDSEGSSRLEVYFEPDVDVNSRVLFLRYVHEHLTAHAENVVRLRRYCCSNKKCKDFEKPYRPQENIDEALLPGGTAKVFCGKCGKPIRLRDAIEKGFESPEVKAEVREMQERVRVVLDNESRELILVGHVYSIVAEAGQIYRGYTNSDHGIDGEIEFKDDQGQATGQRLYVQLKSGDSYLRKRQRDGAEVFQIKKPRWADYWQKQAYPVMLVIRTSDGVIRWMDAGAFLRRECSGGKTVKQVVFEGERLDVMSVRRLRKKILEVDQS